jgi:dihydrofolate reductase
VSGEKTGRKTRRVRLFIAASLDGCIAGPRGGIDWLFHDQDYGYADFLASVDTVLMGRKSYEASLTLGQWPKRLALWVFTRSPKAFANRRFTFTDASPAEVVARLRKQKGRDLWLLGGGELVKAFLERGLVDEMMVAVHPLVLGRGIPLFPPGTRRTALRLAESHAYDSGLVMLTYKVEKPGRRPAKTVRRSSR